MKHRVGGRPGGRVAGWPAGRVDGGHVHKHALSGPNLHPARSKQVGFQVGTECGKSYEGMDRWGTKILLSGIFQLIPPI